MVLIYITFHNDQKTYLLEFIRRHTNVFVATIF